MRTTLIAGVLAVVAPALAAQTVVQSEAPRAAALTAEVHYGTAGDAWITTNKPAYVALFDVSRGGVTQLYPVFSEQAAELAGPSLRVELRSPMAGTGRSSLVSLNGPGLGANAQGWPHTLLLVASTQPLRVGNSWTTNISLNNALVRDRDWNSLTTDAGVDAVIGLVRPTDGRAEVVTDEAQTATPALYASSLSHDPNFTVLGYNCYDATSMFVSLTPVLGASCFPTRDLSSNALASRSVHAAAGPASTDTTRVLSTNARPAASGTSRISTNRQPDVQSISDPAAIRKFMEDIKATRGTADASGSGAPRGGQHPNAFRDANGAQNREVHRDGVNAAHRNGDGPQARPESHQQQDAHPRSVEVRPSNAPGSQGSDHGPKRP